MPSKSADLDQSSSSLAEASLPQLCSLRKSALCKYLYVWNEENSDAVEARFGSQSLRYERVARDH
ncbi:MAG: hypothetical protein WC966_00975 [Bradymonadales bacterium]